MVPCSAWALLESRDEEDDELPMENLDLKEAVLDVWPELRLSSSSTSSDEVSESEAAPPFSYFTEHLG